MKGVRIDYDRVRGATSRKGVALAKHLGIHQTTFSRKMTGRISLTINEIDKIAKYLGVDASRFLEFYDVSEEDSKLDCDWDNLEVLR